MQKPEAGYGFILIDTPEKKKAMGPKRPTDMFWLVDHWEPVDIETFFDSGSVYRRPIDPGDGFELVPWNESPKLNDEITYDGSRWQEYGGIAESVKRFYELCSGTNVLAFRRRKQPAAQSDGWVDARTVKPTTGQEFWFLDSDGKIWNRHNLPSFWPEHWTHWRPVKPGEIPAPPKSREELAFESWAKTQPQPIDPKAAFLAGVKGGQ